MTVLFGHPTGNPNSHNAALAHFEAGWLEAFCVPWMPTELELALLARVPGVQVQVERLRRRSFPALRDARKVQGRLGEWSRMLRRLAGGEWADERLSYQANDWLMAVMSRECRRPAVTAVHAYEDCALLQFREAARTGKSRIYDLPIGYYPAWESTFNVLAEKYAAWLPRGGARGSAYARPEQKRMEMDLADLVLVPSTFVKKTVQSFADREVAIAGYGVDSEFWHPLEGRREEGPLRFLYAGQCSVRKGTPLLIEAWRRAALKDATLDLVGQWQLSEERRAGLTGSIRLRGPASPEILRTYYRSADIFVFPSNFEGYGLVILEAMACGLPVIATDATAGPDVLDGYTGRVIPADDLDALVSALRWAGMERDGVARMRATARRSAEGMAWKRYRMRVREATAPFVSGGKR